jgi:hypothetical protein
MEEDFPGYGRFIRAVCASKITTLFIQRILHGRQVAIGGLSIDNNGLARYPDGVPIL